MKIDLWTNEVFQGDCIELMQNMPKESIDSVVTDPPYNFDGGFMGKEWDDFGEPKQYQKWCEKWGKECLRVLKPGGHILAFSGTHSFHRLAVGLEDAGFDIKTTIMWIFGTGFPKSHDISKAIDKMKDEEREVIKERYKGTHKNGNTYQYSEMNDETGYSPITAPATPEAEQWQGWGTALKPAFEPIVLAQKPRENTYAENVLKYGVGGLNIDGCRIEHDEPVKKTDRKKGQGNTWNDDNTGLRDNPGDLASPSQKGRFPANVILDPQSARLLDRQSGELHPGVTGGDKATSIYGSDSQTNRQIETYSDKGGASRFFYSSKAHKSERNAGLEDLEDRHGGSMVLRNPRGTGRDPEHQDPSQPVKNDIATLKPINLMRYLCRLVTPPNGIILDPFAGSGTTGCSSVIEGFNYILIEKRERFAEVIAPNRIKYWSREENQDELKDHNLLTDDIQVPVDILPKVHGIGEKTMENVKERQEMMSLSELKSIDGIGEKTIKRIKDKICED